MIIDTHVHTFPDSVAPHALNKLIKSAGGNIKPYTDGTISGLLKSMEKAHVNISVNLPIATKPDQTDSITEYAIKNSKKYKNIIFFSSIHPENKIKHIKKIFKKLKEEGIKGIKLHPQYQNFPVDSSKVFQIYEEAIKNNIILHFHSGFDIGFPTSDYASVERFDRMLSIFNGIKVILAHGGGYKDWDKVEKILKYENVYLDTSFTLDFFIQGEESLNKIYTVFTDRIVFGTDSPWQDQKEDIQKLNSTSLSSEQKEKVFYKNYMKLIESIG